VKNEKLPKTLITPTTKGSADGHDRPITEKEILAEGLVTKRVWGELLEKSLAVFARGSDHAAKQGLILVDTKFEFGLDQEGKVVLADEILTPDSSRYWIAKSYEKKLAQGQEPESLDKEFLRLWIRSRCDPYRDRIPEIPPQTLMAFSEKYISLYEQVTGRVFKRPSPKVPVRERIKLALERTFPEYFQRTV
ncbi:MAG: phosphoribosylaminoimidazolesuccinocarboxamide synthase, partial [Kiloniellales bacterium]|nr:phosphoribosylaminoimidazolesuccinocarboxamide synthase [Kiloniellales bacterium]